MTMKERWAERQRCKVRENRVWKKRYKKKLRGDKGVQFIRWVGMDNKSIG